MDPVKDPSKPDVKPAYRSSETYTILGVIGVLSGLLLDPPAALSVLPPERTVQFTELVAKLVAALALGFGAFRTAMKIAGIFSAAAVERVMGPYKAGTEEE